MPPLSKLNTATVLTYQPGPLGRLRRLSCVRVPEVVVLKVTHIDSERMLIRVERGSQPVSWDTMLSANRLEGSRHVVMLRRGLMRDHQDAGIVPTADNAFNFSMWRGYLSKPYHAKPLEWCCSAGAEIADTHTSGHASSADLRAFATALRPKLMMSVHGVKSDAAEAHGFGIVRRLADTG